MPYRLRDALVLIAWVTCALAPAHAEEPHAANVTVCDITRHPELFRNVRVRLEALVTFDQFRAANLRRLIDPQSAALVPCKLSVELGSRVDPWLFTSSRPGMTVGPRQRPMQLSPLQFGVVVTVEGRVIYNGRPRVVRDESGKVVTTNFSQWPFDDRPVLRIEEVSPELK